jgi:hypothetical protein
MDISLNTRGHMTDEPNLRKRKAAYIKNNASHQATNFS